jgi:methyl-accepting chemotaxis protein
MGEERPNGRRYQARILLMSGAMSIVTIALISLYLTALLRFTPAQWTRFAWIVSGLFVVLFAAQAWMHEAMWSPLVRCLDRRAEGSASDEDLREGFRAISGLPARMFLWSEFWWGLGGLLVALGMAYWTEGFRLLSGVAMVVSSTSGGFVMGLIYYFALKRMLAGMRQTLAEEVGDPEVRSPLVRRVSVNQKLVVTVTGMTAMVVLFASLLASVAAGRSVESSAVAMKRKLLDHIVRDYAERGEVAIGDGAGLAVEMGIAESLSAFPESGPGSEAEATGLSAAELSAIREIGLEGGDSLSFDSDNVIVWQRLPDGRVLVVHSAWGSVWQMMRANNAAFVAFFCIAVGLAFATARLLSDDISHATAVLRGEAERLASGDLRRGRIWESEDELGDLARSFEVMGESLRQTVLRVAEAAERVDSSAGLLAPVSSSVAGVTAEQVEGMERAAASMEEIDAQVRGIARSSSALNESVEESSSSILELGASGEELNETAVRLHESVEGVSSSIEQMIRSVKQVLENTESLSSAAEETSASMEEMASSLREVDTSADETSRLSAQVVDRAETGRSKVRETIEGMEAIQQATETAERVIRGLHGRTVEIGAIVDVIDDVADETNLLALNAAIIAAQAGEHGKAFSVVADEIKDLAERVLASTKEIGGLIAAVQEEASAATTAIEQGTSSVASGVERSAEAGMALEAITRASRESGQRMSGIVVAVRAQAKGAGHVVELMEKVRAGVEQIRRASVEQDGGHAVVSQSSVMMREVAQQVRGTTEEQARGSSRIRESIEGVREAVEQINAALQEQSQACASALSGLEAVQNRTRSNEDAARTLDEVTHAMVEHAESLRREVSRFRV